MKFKRLKKGLIQREDSSTQTEIIIFLFIVGMTVKLMEFYQHRHKRRNKQQDRVCGILILVPTDLISQENKFPCEA